MIEVERLTFTYPNGQAKAVDNISFKVDRGQVFGFLGPSGAGKSTVQNIMTGLLPLQQGSVRYGGKTLAEMGKSFYAQIGVSFEHPNLYEKLTGLENLRYYAGLFPSGSTRSPDQLLQLVGLTDAKHKRAGQYSKGMKQRLVFARALINQPSILFLDEPLSGLDPATSQQIKQVIMDEKKRGVTIFLTTHNMHLADDICDTVAFINEGRILTQDSPRELKLRYGTKAVRVEWAADGEVKSETLFLERPEDRRRLERFVASGVIQTMHSQEATLEQIFIELTGRGLS
ncbi:MAG: ATP-binding cassette domain-containing protein [Bacillota bacterium]